jgi:hypothetical protein
VAALKLLTHPQNSRGDDFEAEVIARRPDRRPHHRASPHGLKEPRRDKLPRDRSSARRAPNPITRGHRHRRAGVDALASPSAVILGVAHTEKRELVLDTHASYLQHLPYGIEGAATPEII